MPPHADASAVPPHADGDGAATVPPPPERGHRRAAER
ncbi:hypothetical protein Ae406Ps2_4924c [Pseudonocardia sp. Ae406_Ps2]|nr:hypothetical protein Ae331Ps2_1031 [Pseudonocardia sp. Ae331_Ps2]OLM04924.1 hypothetical protein Ae406Ps2_4924c [Pseudonocardia sp. Ae406_Ps2]OLM10243.1 hypothetical protein Ae505Ps2_0365 [Pseudonocardia sp. Ae505_Ps2]OLM26496.1 hypothetical protein Ae706Ps2_4929c [Pseudonocardia sp. Ae706_Ps2]